MKIKHLLLFGALAALGSCSTAYRSGQTPDDVYYSPAPEQSSYVTSMSEKDQNSYNYRNSDEENDIRRGIENPVYRNSITFSMGMGYGYSPYSLYPYNAFNNPFYYDQYAYSPYGMKGLYSPYYNPYNDYAFYSPYSMYNSFGYYNPYSFYSYSPYSYGYGYGYNPYSPIFLSGGSLNTNRGARKYNLNAYGHTGNTGVRGNLQPDGISRPGTSMPVRSATTETSAPVRRNGVGNVIRRVFTPSERNTYKPPANNNTRVYRNTESNRTYNNNNYNRTESQAPVRSFTPSESSSSSSGSSNSSAPVRTFRR